MISRTTDRMLVKNVKEHRCLFERQDENFKNNVAKDAAWVEVAAACNAPGIENLDSNAQQIVIITQIVLYF